MRILVVEDEQTIARFVARRLEAEGYAVTCVGDGDEGRRRALDDDVDFVVLDRMLPDRDGLELLAEIRRVRPRLPVLVLSARAEIEDRVEGLDAGATDYLTKPFALDELTARVRAHLRRPAEPEPTRLETAGIAVDLLTRQAWRTGTEIHLTAREFDLLVYFLQHPGQALGRAQILSAVWGLDFDPGTNVVEVYVGYLRRKLERTGEAAPIQTLRHVGYRLSSGTA